MNTLNLMLCDQCHEREATIYFTAVAAFADEVTNHNFCAPCYEAIALA
jgi:protein-arginine kinase activator protein McsA